MYVMPFCMGPHRLAHRPDRRRDHRLALCRRQHAHHDAHGQGRCSMRWATTATSCRACTPSARRCSPARRTSPGRATRSTSTSSISPRSGDLVLRLGLRRQRAARQEVLRAAHRLGHGAAIEGWLAEHMLILGVDSPEGREDLCRGGLPQRLRQDQPRHAGAADALPGLEGRRPSATTSPGSSRARTAASTPSTRRPASSAWRRAPATRPTRTRWTRIKANTIFTNVALTDDGDVWWEGHDEEAAARS